MPGNLAGPTTITLDQLIQTGINLFRLAVALTLFGMLVYGGYTRMTAAGDPDKEKLSVQIIVSAIVGFIIIILAPDIINIVGGLIGLRKLF